MFQPSRHKRPRAEASLGNARGPSPVYVCVYRQRDTRWQETPKASRVSDSGPPPPHYCRHSLSQEESKLGATGRMRAPPEQLAAGWASLGTEMAVRSCGSCKTLHQESQHGHTCGDGMH